MSSNSSNSSGPNQDWKEVLHNEKSRGYSWPTEMKEKFSQDGFLVLPDFIDHSTADALIQEANKLVHDHIESQKKNNTDVSVFSTLEGKQLRDKYFLESSENISFFFEEGTGPNTPSSDSTDNEFHSVNKIGHALHEKDPVFKEFTEMPKCKEVIQRLDVMKGKTLIPQSMYIFKQKKVGGKVSPHQDSTFLFTDPLSTVGYWLALEEATLTNGCLWVVPGSHSVAPSKRFIVDPISNQTVFVPNTYNNNNLASTASDGQVGTDSGATKPVSEQGLSFTDDQYIPVPVKKGTLIMLHGSLVHKSEANTSEKSRHAYSWHVVDSKTNYLPDNWLQRSTPFPSYD